MNKLLLAATSVVSLPMAAGVIVVGLGNDGRQCPPSPVLVPLYVLNKSAPENNFCFSIGPSGNTLIGYTNPFNTSQLIVWTPFADIPPAALTLGEESGFTAPPQPPSTPPPAGPSIPLLSWFAPPSPPSVIPNPTVPPLVTPQPPLIAGAPEPSTILLCAVGLLALGTWRAPRRRIP